MNPIHPILSAAALALLAVPAPAQERARARIEVGPLDIRTYELRETRFERPFRVIKDDGSAELHDWGWQVVILGENFPTRALDPILWVDDVALLRYERCLDDGREALVYTFFEPRILRAERTLEVIYGNDERTRTKLLERLDPERLVRLPEEERRRLRIPDPEGMTLDLVARDGRVGAHGAVSEGTRRIAARLASGSWRLLPAAVEAKEGRTRAKVEWPEGATHAALVLVMPGSSPAAGDFPSWPKGVEPLDVKPIESKPSDRR